MSKSSDAMITGLTALAGAVIGAAATGYVQYILQARQDSYAEQQQRLETAGKIITLIEESPITMLKENAAASQPPLHLTVPLTDPERVLALTTLYFPSAVKAARGYAAESTEYVESLSEIAKHSAGNPKQANQTAFYCTLEAGDQVQSIILTALHKPYANREPVIPLSSCKDYQYEQNH